MPGFGFPFAGPFGGDEDDTGANTRMMLNLLPPGRAWRMLESSLLFQMLAATADEIGRLVSRSADLIEEADPQTSVELLPEHERELELDGDGTDEERQARVVARRIARQRYRPSDFQIALAPLLGQDAEDVVVLETSHAGAVAIGDVREIFRFYIYRDPDEPGDYQLDAAEELANVIKPSHTACHLIESVDFCCDDEFSLCDRDLLGA